jgi:hypothetical protein
LNIKSERAAQVTTERAFAMVPEPDQLSASSGMNLDELARISINQSLFAMLDKGENCLKANRGTRITRHDEHQPGSLSNAEGMLGTERQVSSAFGQHGRPGSALEGPDDF